MGIGAYVAIYLVVWWTVLFAVLPWGVQSHHEAGVDPKDGGDPGAPVNPMLKKKFLQTTVIAAGIFVVLWVIVYFKLVTIPPLARTY